MLLIKAIVWNWIMFSVMLLNKAIVWNVFFCYAFASSDCIECVPVML
jgi:hypothetical protein